MEDRESSLIRAGVVLVKKLELVYVLQAAGLAAENRSQAVTMVRVGRWSNTWVRES